MPSIAPTRWFRAVVLLVVTALGLVLGCGDAEAAKPKPKPRTHAHASAHAAANGKKRVVKHPWAKNHVAARPHGHAKKRR